MSVLVLSCSENEDEAFNLPIDESNFVEMMAEIHIAEAAAKLSNQTKDRDFPFELSYVYANILKKYQFDQDKLEKELLLLAEHPIEMQKIYKKIETQIKDIQNSMKN